MPIKEEYQITLARRLTRPFLRAIFRIIFRTLTPIQMIGKENIPRRQSYIVAINHVSLYDPPLIIAFWPVALEAMGAVDIWHRPGQDILVRLYGGIPVHRSEYDRRLFDRVLSVLRSNYPLLIAPEGGRSHAPGLRRAKPGVAYIVEESGLPVLPVGIIGTTDDFWKKASKGKRPRLEIRVGRAVNLPHIQGKGAERRASRQSNADLVMSHIAGLLPKEYRGFYASSAIAPSKTGQ